MQRFTGIRAITFDVGGTLIRPWPSVGHVYAEVAARHGVKADVPALNQRFARAWKALKEFHHGRDEWAAIVDATFDGLASEPPSRTFFPELFDRFAEARAWQIFEDVFPALDALAAAGMNLGIISNWDDRLRPLLHRLNLTRRFEAIIVSCEVGFPKPSPVIFEHAAKKLGVPPSAVLHVGDSHAHDIVGAESAGFQCVRVERSPARNVEIEIRSLRDVEGLLEVE